LPAVLRRIAHILVMADMISDGVIKQSRVAFVRGRGAEPADTVWPVAAGSMDGT